MDREFLRKISENQGIIHKVTGIYCDNPEDRKDLFQEILIQLWKSYESFRNESKFSTWMYRVALNTAITAFKKASRHPLGNHPVESVNFQLAAEEYDYEFEENLKLLHKAIEQLTGVEKSIILLYLEDKKYD